MFGFHLKWLQNCLSYLHVLSVVSVNYLFLCLQQEKEMDSERIEDLLAQNAQLELDARH